MLIKVAAIKYFTLSAFPSLHLIQDYYTVSESMPIEIAVHLVDEQKDSRQNQVGIHRFIEWLVTLLGLPFGDDEYDGNQGSHLPQFNTDIETDDLGEKLFGPHFKGLKSS